MVELAPRANEAARRAALLSQMRSHHRNGERVHRPARHHRRPLRQGARRAGSRLEGHLRSLQAAQHGRRDPAHRTKAACVAFADKWDTLRLLLQRRPDSQRLQGSVRPAPRRPGRGPNPGRRQTEPSRSSRQRPSSARVPARPRRLLLPRSARLQVRRSARLHGRRLGRSARPRSAASCAFRPSVPRRISSRSPPASNASRTS